MQRIVLLCSPKQLSRAIIHFTQMAQEGVIQHCLRLSSLPRWHPANVHFQPSLFTFQPISVLRAFVHVARTQTKQNAAGYMCARILLYWRALIVSCSSTFLMSTDIIRTHTDRDTYTHTCTHTDTKQPDGLQWVSTAARCFAILWSMQRMQHLIILMH